MIISFKAVTKFLQRCWVLLAILVIGAAVISSFFRALTPWAIQYKGEVEYHLSKIIGRPVTIDTMQTGWYWFEPIIKLEKVKVSNGKNDITVGKLFIGINLFSSLWHWQIQPGILYIDSLNLAIRQKDNQWQIDGLEEEGKPKLNLDEATSYKWLVWVLAQQKIIIKNVSATLYLQDKTNIPVKDFNLMMTKRYGSYRIRGGASLAPIATSIQLLGEVALNPDAIKDSKGHMFVSAERLQLSPWQKFLPPFRFKVEEGVGDIQLWLDWRGLKVKTAQSTLTLQHLVWQDSSSKKKQTIPYMHANLAWVTQKDGGELTADHLKFSLGNTVWPENKFMLRYQNSHSTYFFYVQHLILESLFSIPNVWPESFHSILATMPHGKLEETQLTLKDGQLAYLLTKFDKLSWKALDAIPGVENLRGVLHWQTEEGRLELDTEQGIIKPNNKPPIHSISLNASLSWKELSQGLHIHLDRLVINHPNLLISASGGVGEVSRTSAGQLDLTAQVSATHAQRWLTYLPSSYLKPKLDAWLKNDIKKIDSLVAEVNLHGLAPNFPFDKKPGEFQIKGFARGADLVFAKNWPLTTDMEAYLHLDKRDLNIDIAHANLQGTLVNNGNIRINAIGLDREVLLLHTKMVANGKKALAYLRMSPLNKKLSALNMLRLYGNFALDLKLEAPLYPENDEVLTLGNISFPDNQVTVKHSLADIPLNSLNGSLQFDQEGIINGSLKAMIMDYPVNILIQSIRQVNPHVLVNVKGKTTMDVLRNKFNLPTLSLIHGSFGLEAILTLTRDLSDFEHIQLKSSLVGVAVDLPKPLQKTADSKNPLTLDIDFNQLKQVRVRMNYHEALSGDLWFSRLNDRFHFDKGEIRIGGGQALSKKPKGLSVVGDLPMFDFSEWQGAFAKSQLKGEEMSGLDLVQVDVLLKKATIASQQYDDMRIRMSQSKAQEWLINIDQQEVVGKLNYQMNSNSLQGELAKFHFKKASNKEELASKSSLSSLKVKDMPNLDLRIQDFEFGDFDLGEMTIKTTRLEKSWQLNFCKIRTPFYDLTAKGEWRQDGPVNETTIDANLQIRDLAKTLSLWKISPAVEAHKGNIKFQGTWPGTFHDFSLTKLSGQMAISFKNGRITNLSPETEEKLGIGKLLSILSLQTIPRRLKLDFSDLSSHGYSFDEFKGNFALAKGLLSTQDSYIDRPIAYASMKGDLDVAQQVYDLDLKVTPHVTASLPVVVATIAGSPIAGIAIWVANKIINKGMQKVTGYTYKISGPWKQPVVQQVSIIKQKKT